MAGLVLARMLDPATAQQIVGIIPITFHRDVEIYVTGT
jgi:hypothetical protein